MKSCIKFKFCFMSGIQLRIAYVNNLTMQVLTRSLNSFMYIVGVGLSIILAV